MASIFWGGAKADEVADFDEYDPTPYGGGYDIALTFGRAIPPSDETCYPISTATSSSSTYESHGAAEQHRKPQQQESHGSAGYGRRPHAQEEETHGSASVYGHGRKAHVDDDDVGGYRKPKPAYGDDDEGGYRKPKPAYGDDEGGYRKPKPVYGDDDEGGYRKPKPAYGDDERPSYGRKKNVSSCPLSPDRGSHGPARKFQPRPARFANSSKKNLRFANAGQNGLISNLTNRISFVP
jgi:hypothetical protein